MLPDEKSVMRRAAFRNESLVQYVLNGKKLVSCGPLSDGLPA
jgi:hypothetical protein